MPEKSKMCRFQALKRRESYIVLCFLPQSDIHKYDKARRIRHSRLARQAMAHSKFGLNDPQCNWIGLTILPSLCD